LKRSGSKIKIVADADIPFLKGVLEDVAQVDYLPGRGIRTKDLVDADAMIIRSRTQCDKSLLNGTPVKFIATATIGYDHIDAEYCGSRGIEWTNAPGCNSSSVEQYMLSVLLSVAGHHKLRLEDITIGIIGVGHVGSKVERICRAMGMKVLLNDPPRERMEGPDGFVSLETIRQEANIITLHVPLNRSGEDKTLHLADGGFFDGLKRKPIIINSSRGKVVDGNALKDALATGRVRAAVLDVWEGEPDPDLELMYMADLATPHIAGYSVDGKANGTAMSVQALSRFFGLGLDDWQPDGLPLPRIDNLIVDGSRFDLQDLLVVLARRAYDVLRDDDVLRKNPRKFEYLRVAYPVRREPSAIRVNIINDYIGAGPVMRQLGFRIRTDHYNDLTKFKPA
jgi:erythronate-4-phosphate dehydrogenase